MTDIVFLTSIFLFNSSDKFGYECASQLLVASDVSDNNALDWAADSGEVNIIEYLMRRNINPLRTNYNGRSALHIAAKYGRLEAARFLVKCGCDPFQRSSDNESPMSLAAASNNREIISVLNRKSDSGKRDHTRQSKFSSKSRMRSASPDLGSLVGIPGGHQTPGQVELECDNSNIAKKMNASNEFANINDRDGGVAVMPSLLRDPDPGLSLYVVDKRGSRRPHAIFRLRPSRIEFALFYGLMVAGYWILAICIRFYVWVILVVVSVLLFRCAVTPLTLSSYSTPHDIPHICHPRHIEMKLQVAEADKRSNHTNTGMGRTRFQVD